MIDELEKMQTVRKVVIHALEYMEKEVLEKDINFKIYILN